MFVHGWFENKFFARLHQTHLIYVTCWEDPRLDRVAMEIKEDDTVLAISSAGCNVLDYVYPGVYLIFKGAATPQDILQHIHPSDFQVKTTPPDNSSKLLKRLAWIVGISLLLGFGYWMWKTVW